MRPRTLLALAGVSLLLVAAVAFAVFGGGSGTLTEEWVSDTARDNTVNHHAVGVGPNGTVIAPVAAVVNLEAIGPQSCSLVRLAPANGAVRWRGGIAPENCTAHALTEPAIADVDGDGVVEAIAGTTEQRLVVWDAETGDREWTVPLSTFGYGRPTVANLTAAPGREIVTSDSRGTVSVVNDRGILWRESLNTTTWAEPIAGDVDGDGSREVLVGTNDEVVLLAADGTVEWRTDTKGVSIAAADVDDDPQLEVFAGHTDTVVALDGATGAQAWTREVDGSASLHAGFDGDGDDQPEVYIGLSGGTVASLAGATGEIEWRTTLSAGERASVPPPVAADLDGDGNRELVAVTSSGHVAALDPGSGDQLATYAREVPVWTFPSAVDLDGDGDSEVLVRYGDGRVAALDYET
jgi:outer membrane protein assembly factor BamB